MSHARQQVRDAVVTAVTGLTTTGTRVHGGRIFPLHRARLPALFVYSIEEAVDDGAEVMGLDQVRVLQVAVEVLAEANADLDDSIDTICAEVETAIHADTTLGGVVMWIEYASVEITLDEGTQKPVGAAQMTFVAQYRVDATDPTTIIT